MGHQMRLMLTGNPSWTQWAGGFLSVDQIAPNILVVLKDLFWESRSWNTLNLGMPYLDTAMTGLLIIGFGSSLILSESRPSLLERQWVWVSMLSALGSVGLSALTGVYPGVRRIFPSMLLLYLIAGLGLQHLWRWVAFRPMLIGAVAVYFSLVSLQSYAIAHNSWPLSGQSDFMVVSREWLLQKGDSRQEVVIIAYNSDQYLGQHYRCALSLDDTLNARFKSVRVIRQADLDQRHDLQSNVILLANQRFSNDQLQAMFGSLPTAATLRRPFTSPRPGALAAIYEFIKAPKSP
jgi:hypothetical protein